MRQDIEVSADSPATLMPNCVPVFSQFVKCGFAGDNFPRASFPCMVGRPMLRTEEGFSERQLKVVSLLTELLPLYTVLLHCRCY